MGKRSSHQDQAASLERANTQLAALGRDVEQLQRQQPKLTQLGQLQLGCGGDLHSHAWAGPPGQPRRG